MRKTSAEIAAEIRERICLQGGVGDMLLHEGQLATEFGVSRTPIRQVLQMLAYESLVETRSGIGTIVTPLREDARGMDEMAYRAILTAAGACPLDGGAIPDMVWLRLTEARRQVLGVSRAPSDGTPAALSDQALFGAMAGLLDATALLVGDHIVVSALRAAYWRHIRWCIAAGEEWRIGAAPALAALIEDAIGAMNEGDLPALLGLLTRRAV